MSELFWFCVGFCLEFLLPSRISRVGAFGVFVVAACLFFSGCSLSVAGRPIVAVDDGVASRTVDGAAVGAAAGAAGGAIAGDPGKGAAIGAAAGGIVGLLSGIFGGSRYGTPPCWRWPEGSAQRDACLRGYGEASTVEAERQGRCAGGDPSACHRYYYGGGGLGGWGHYPYRRWW